MRTDKLKQIDQLLMENVAEGKIAGGSVLVSHYGKEVYYGCAGYERLDEKKPFTRDTIVRLYSMTKPITSAAVFMLVEQGKIDLLEPVSNYLSDVPKYPYTIESGVKKVFEKPITIKDLLNMTSGMPYPGDESIAQVKAGELINEVIGKMDSDEALSTMEIARRALHNPTDFAPGEMWEYGFSADILGAVVEAVSGMRFSDFLKKNIFEPLDMKDTDFWVPEEKQDRLSYVYDKGINGVIRYKESHLCVSNDMKKAPAFESGGAGLVSTIDDYQHFCQMLLNEGNYNGKQILSPKTIDYMRSGGINDWQKRTFNWDKLTGYSYGNLMRVLEHPSLAITLGEAGEYGWDGWLGCHMAIDPVNKLTFVIMYQLVDGSSIPLNRHVQNIVYSSL